MRKKSKLKQRIQQLLILAFTIGFLGTYYQTQHVILSFSVGVIGIIFLLAVTYFTKNKKQKKILHSGIYDIDKMDGRQFEHYALYLFQSMGYKVKLTPRTNDYGADIVLKQNGKKIVVQAKRYGKNIGVSAVQEVLGAKGYYQADEAWVVSNRFYTPRCVELAKANHVHLIDRDQLIQWMLNVNPNADVSTQKVIEEVEPEKMECPHCRHELKLRRGKYGAFWGCSHYPKCTYIYKGE